MRTISCRHAVFLAIVGVLLLHMGTACAEERAAKDAESRIERVALFKNGLGFFTSGVTLPKDAAAVRLGQLPVPSFGTFWVGYGKNVSVRGLVASMEEVDEQVAVQSISQLLEANAGRKVKIRVGPGEDDILEGIVVSTDAETAGPETPSPYFMEARRTPERSHVPGGASSNLLLIRTDAGIVALHAGSATRVDFEGDDVVYTVTAEQKRPSIRLELERPAGGADLSITYLARGISWAPSYLLDLSDPERARFSARALIINEVADLDGVQLELVTGFPNIKFADVVSPIAMSQGLSDFLKALAGGRSEAGSQRYMMAQQMVLLNEPVFDAFEAAPVPSYSTAAAGAVAEDLFLYPVKDFTLKKGETAWIPLFTAEMPYKHIYTWRIGDCLDEDDRYRQGRRREDGEVAEEVWHSCRLVNQLEMPLTTAAAEFIKEGAFTGQDVCYYTAPGATTTIRINRAMNVLAEQGEVELERSRNVKRLHGYEYDLVKVRGELTLRSRLDKAVNVEVSKELSGEVLETESPAKDVQTAEGLRQVNPRHVLTWDIALKSGEERTLTYVYQVYVRS